MRKPGAPAAPLGAFVGDLVRPALAARGLGEASLITHWEEIVGVQIGAFARPIQLQWPPRGAKRNPDEANAPGTLVLRVDGAFALEAQHASATIVARVNAHLGWRCIDKVAFRQGPLEPLKRPPSRIDKPSPQSIARARELGRGIEDEGLREALTQLGARVIDNAARKR